MEYHLSKIVEEDFDKAITKTTEALKLQGFGIITVIDMKETFKKKLDISFRNYTILGACNPRFAYESLLEESRFGVFLPCNVVVQQHDDGRVEVSIVNPEEMVHSTDNLTLRMFATQIKTELMQVLQHL